MTFQAPIFESGLFGKANRFVCNSWTQSAQLVAENAEGLDWAQRQLVKGSVPTAWLARVTAATPYGANRWLYTFEAVVLTAAHGVQAASGTWGKGTNAVNIREITNTSNTADGSPVPAGATIGPVGSTYSSGWTFTLNGIVQMNLSYDAAGNAAWWFSAPNPVRCSA